jgi:hypothetical protein
MFNNEDSITDNVVGSLFLGGLFYLFQCKGRQEAYKEIEEKNQKDEIESLKRQINELRKQKT